MSLESALANIPGIGAYNAARQANEESGLNQVKSAIGIGSLSDALRQRQEVEQVKGVLSTPGGDLATKLSQLQAVGPLGVKIAGELVTLQQHQAATAKLQQDAAMSAQFAGADQNDPSTLGKLAFRAAATNHPGAVGMLTLAQKQQGAQDAAAALQNMQARPGQPAIATGTAPPETVGGGPPVPFDQPATPGQPGIVPDYLLGSKYVGSAAKALQERINGGALGMTPANVEKTIEMYGKSHDAYTQADVARSAGQANKIEIRNMFPPQPRAGSSIAGESGLSKEAIRDLAVQSLYDPNALAGHRRDTKAMGMIANERQNVMKEAGITSQDVVTGRAGYKADSMSLNKLTPQYDAVTAFEKTAIRNGDRLMQLADKVDATGTPVLEKWIRAGRQATGDADVAQFNAQLQIYRTEAARILTNPNLSGQLTDSARHEVEGFLAPGASAQQIRSVVGLLKNDFENRKATLEEQISSIRGRMGNRMAPGSPSPSADAATGDWVTRAMASNPGMSRADVEAEGRRLGKVK